MKTKVAFLFIIIFLISTSLFGIERRAEIIGSRVIMHPVADGDSGKVATLNQGVVVDVIGRSENPSNVENFRDFWYHVSYRGKTGWVFGQFLNLQSNKRGITRIFTRDELIEYCDIELNGLKNLKKAGQYQALIEISLAFLKDLEDLSMDKITSVYVNDIRGYHAAAKYYLALGYVYTGKFKDARRIKDEFLASYGDLTFSDGRSARDVADEIDRLIDEGN
jgi:hypothetical protein